MIRVHVLPQYTRTRKQEESVWYTPSVWVSSRSRQWVWPSFTRYPFWNRSPQDFLRLRVWWTASECVSPSGPRYTNIFVGIIMDNEEWNIKARVLILDEQQVRMGTSQHRVRLHITPSFWSFVIWWFWSSHSVMMSLCLWNYSIISTPLYILLEIVFTVDFPEYSHVHKKLQMKWSSRLNLKQNFNLIPVVQILSSSQIFQLESGSRWVLFQICAACFCSWEARPPHWGCVNDVQKSESDLSLMGSILKPRLESSSYQLVCSGNFRALETSQTWNVHREKCISVSCRKQNSLH